MLAVVNGHIDTAATLLEEDLVVSNADVVDKVWHGPSGACILHHTHKRGSPRCDYCVGGRDRRRSR